jgi:hypothetical protein
VAIRGRSPAFMRSLLYADSVDVVCWMNSIMRAMNSAAAVGDRRSGEDETRSRSLGPSGQQQNVDSALAAADLTLA